MFAGISHQDKLAFFELSVICLSVCRTGVLTLAVHAAGIAGWTSAYLARDISRPAAFLPRPSTTSSAPSELTPAQPSLSDPGPSTTLSLVQVL